MATLLQAHLPDEIARGCPICFDEYDHLVKSPTLLPCPPKVHLCCKVCADKLVISERTVNPNLFKCPFCRFECLVNRVKEMTHYDKVLKTYHMSKHCIEEGSLPCTNTKCKQDSNRTTESNDDENTFALERFMCLTCNPLIPFKLLGGEPEDRREMKDILFDLVVMCRECASSHTLKCDAATAAGCRADIRSLFELCGYTEEQVFERSNELFHKIVANGRYVHHSLTIIATLWMDLSEIQEQRLLLTNQLDTLIVHLVELRKSWIDVIRDDNYFVEDWTLFSRRLVFHLWIWATRRHGTLTATDLNGGGMSVAEQRKQKRIVLEWTLAVAILVGEITTISCQVFPSEDLQAFYADSLKTIMLKSLPTLAQWEVEGSGKRESIFEALMKAACNLAGKLTDPYEEQQLVNTISFNEMERLQERIRNGNCAFGAAASADIVRRMEMAARVFFTNADRGQLELSGMPTMEERRDDPTEEDWVDATRNVLERRRSSSSRSSSTSDSSGSSLNDDVSAPNVKDELEEVFIATEGRISQLLHENQETEDPSLDAVPPLNAETEGGIKELHENQETEYPPLDAVPSLNAETEGGISELHENQETEDPPLNAVPPVNAEVEDVFADSDDEEDGILFMDSVD